MVVPLISSVGSTPCFYFETALMSEVRVKGRHVDCSVKTG
jgi:hypothetical protein